MKKKVIKILLYVVLLLCVLGCIAGNIFNFNRTSSEIDALYNIVDSLHDDFVIEQKETKTGKSKTCIIIDYEESENTTDAPIIIVRLQQNRLYLSQHQQLLLHQNRLLRRSLKKNPP